MNKKDEVKRERDFIGFKISFPREAPIVDLGCPCLSTARA